MAGGELRAVRLPADVWRDLTGIYTSGLFKYVVGHTRFTSTWRIALVLTGAQVVGAAVVRRNGRPGHGQDGLDFLVAEAFSTPVPWSSLVAQVPDRYLPHLDREDGAAFPTRTSAELAAALSRLAPGADAILDRLREQLPGLVAHGMRTSTLREQRDAVALGLEIAGLNSHDLLGEPHRDPGSGDVPFLSGWIRRRVGEAATIRHDATSFDQWLPQRSDHFDMATFRDPRDPARRVTVFYADKEALERQTGTDLLYYRHHRPGFILVQYKRMRADDGLGSTATYYPDQQLRTELARYRALPVAAAATAADDWRLSEDAFFVKLVRDDLRKPSENKLVQGMYLPIGLVDLLLSDAQAGLRPKGWSADSLMTYLSNQEFLLLAKQGYVGTRGATTTHIESLILEAFEAGRGIVLTVDETDPAHALRLRHG